MTMAFIVFEGLDACGKSTLIKGVESHLRQQGRDPLVLRDPGATPLGESLRQLILGLSQDPPVPKAETLLYQAARVQMLETRIRPALEQGQWVLCDRFDSSTVAYQSFARGLNLELIQKINQFVSESVSPDLFIWLNISLEESARRKQLRAQQTGTAMDRLELEGQKFTQKVYEGYAYQAKASPEKWLVLDGHKSPEELVELTLSELRRRQWLSS